MGGLQVGHTNVPKAIHGETVEAVKTRMPEEDFCHSLACFFKVLGDTTRVRILLALGLSEMYVGDIACLLGMTQSAISHQLRILRQARLVRARRIGRISFYALDDEHVEKIMAESANHLSHGDRR